MPDRDASARWTYSEFARLPDDMWYEVIAGEVYGTPTPSPLHQYVRTQVLFALHRFVRQHRLGEVLPGPIDVLFADGDYLEPDGVFVRRERLGIISDRGIEAAPDLIIEVTSPITAERDRGIKRERYAWFGAPHYWIVDVEARQIEVYRMLVDPLHPQIERETVRWEPALGGPVLEISVPEVLRGFE